MDPVTIAYAGGASLDAAYRRDFLQLIEETLPVLLPLLHLQSHDALRCCFVSSGRPLQTCWFALFGRSNKSRLLCEILLRSCFTFTDYYLLVRFFGTSKHTCPPDALPSRYGFLTL